MTPPRPAPTPSGLTKAPSKSHPVVPDHIDAAQRADDALQMVRAGADDPMKPITVRLPRQLVVRLKTAAAAQERPMQEVVADALLAYLDSR